MSRWTPIVVGAALASLLLVAGAAGRDIMDVMVLNFPDPQRIKGTVSIEGPVRNAEMVRLADVIVPPVRPTDTTRLIPGGTIVADGYAFAVLSLTGLVKGDVVKPGVVGAFLVPDEDPIVRALNEVGQIQFALEVQAPKVSGVSGYFASDQPRLAVGFPRYRVLFYNTSDKSVTVTLFAYLTS